MNFKNLHEMNQYYERMNHGGLLNHMRIYGCGNNGLGYKPHNIFIGGTITHKKFDSDNREQLGKAERAYSTARESIMNNQHLSELERDKDIKEVEKYLRAIVRKRESFEKEDLENENKEDFEYLEANYDNLDEDEMERYLVHLANYHTDNADNATHDITERDRKIYNILKGEKYKDAGFRYKDEEDFENEDYKYKGEDKIKIDKYESNDEIIDNDYKLPLFNNAKDKVEKMLEDSEIPLDEWDKIINTETGNIVETELGQYKKVFDYLTKTNGNIMNTSIEDSPYYTDTFKKYNNDSKIQNLIRFPKRDGGDHNNKYKVDYLVNDYICQNTMFEVKALTKTYNQYKKQKFINLVSGKITGSGTEFKPFYKTVYDDKNKIVNKCVENVYRTDIDDKKTSQVYNNGNLNYIVIFVLSDGIFFYEPLKDDKFEILKNGRGKLNYGKVSYGDEEGRDYKIPIDKLIRLPQHLLKSFLKK